MKKDKIDALSLILDIDPLVFIYGIDDKESAEPEQITSKELLFEVKELVRKTIDISEQEKKLLLQTLDFVCSDKK